MLVAGGLWSAASQLLPAGGTAVLSVVAARALGSEALGRQSLIAYVNMAVAAVLVSALATAVLQRLGYLAGQEDPTGVSVLAAWFRRSGLAVGAATGLVMCLIGLLSGHDRLAWTVVGLAALADAAADGIAARMLVEEGYTPVSRLRLFFQLLGPPLGVVGIVAGFGITGIFAGDALAALGLWLALAIRQRRRRRAGKPAGGGEPVSFRPPVPLARSYLLFAANGAITQIVARRVEFLVLAALSSSREVAMYSVAFTTVSLVALLPAGIASAALPLVAAAEGEGRIEAAARHLRFSVRVGTLLSLPVTALVAALGPGLVHLVYGSQYDEAARLVPLSATALLVPVAVSMCSQWWSGRGQLRIVLVTGALAAVVDVGCAAALAARYGAKGAVIAKLAGSATLAAGLLIITSRRIGGFGWRARGLLLTALISAVAGGVSLAVLEELHQALDRTLVGQLSALVVAGLAGSLVAVLGASAAGILEGEEADWLRPVLPDALGQSLERLTRRRPGSG